MSLSVEVMRSIGGLVPDHGALAEFCRANGFALFRNGSAGEFPMIALLKRPYLVLGISAFGLLLPLALTSNDASVRRLRGAWRRLHRLVYPAVLLGVGHYLWQMKVISVEGWSWAAAAGVLLALRFPWFRRASRG